MLTVALDVSSAQKSSLIKRRLSRIFNFVHGLLQAAAYGAGEA